MFRVDVDGLRKKFAHCSKNFLLYELYQNAVDEDVRQVHMELAPLDDEHCRLIVEDDSPEGFKDLTHSYTLFRESSKLHNPEQRGIWNLGEKLVLAFCSSAAIISTKGSVLFQDGLRYHFEARRTRGTLFDGVLLMNPAEYDECCRGVSRLIPPAGKDVWFNGQLLTAPPLRHEFRVTLPTTIGDPGGSITRTRRITTVRVYDPLPGRRAAIYEMGIPVVETDDKWHYDVQQRVPLNMQRDNVTPAYLQELRVAVFNEMHTHLEEDDANADWARACTNDRRCSQAAMNTALDLRFGKKRVAYDPSDPEANKRAVAAGYVLVHGRSLSRMEWANARDAEAIRPAGQVTPSDKAWDGDHPFYIILPGEYTPGMRAVDRYVHQIAPELIGHDVAVQIVNEPMSNTLASYGPGGPLTLNYGRLGNGFFDRRTWEGLEAINDLLIHEFGHEVEGDHLSRRYYAALTMLGARLATAALHHPDYFRDMVQTWGIAERRLLPPRANLN